MSKKKRMKKILISLWSTRHTHTQCIQCMACIKSLHILSTIKDYVCTLLDRLNGNIPHSHSILMHTHCATHYTSNVEVRFWFSFQTKYTIKFLLVCFVNVCVCFFLLLLFILFFVHVWWHYQRETSTNN